MQVAAPFTEQTATALASMQVYGGAAQDFGTARPNWESYGWSMFRLADPPTGNRPDVIIQVNSGSSQAYRQRAASCALVVLAEQLLMPNIAVQSYTGFSTAVVLSCPAPISQAVLLLRAYSMPCASSVCNSAAHGRVVAQRLPSQTTCKCSSSEFVYLSVLLPGSESASHRQRGQWCCCFHQLQRQGSVHRHLQCHWCQQRPSDLPPLQQGHQHGI